MAEKDVQEQEKMDETPDSTGDFDNPAGENTGIEAQENPSLNKMKEELEASKDKYLRLVAEFDNFRRRSSKERIDLIQTAGREVITELLAVVDDCDRAQKQAGDGLNEGILLIFNKLRSILQSKGLKAMDSVGKEFDPDLHEAITEIPAPVEELKGKVVDEVVKGYYLNDKLIRHAKVVVGK